MKRYWISWYSGIEPEADIPYPCWITGESAFGQPGDDDFHFTYVGDVQAESEQAAYEKIAELFPDFRERGCNEIAMDWQPSDRFQ